MALVFLLRALALTRKKISVLDTLAGGRVFLAQYSYCWLRLRLRLRIRTIPLTSGIVGKNGNLNREQYILNAVEFSVLGNVCPSFSISRRRSRSQKQIYCSQKRRLRDSAGKKGIKRFGQPAADLIFFAFSICISGYGFASAIYCSPQA